MNYKNTIQLENVSQTQKARADQVLNAGGGYVFQLDVWKRLDRFLTIGAKKPSYYEREEDIARENSLNIMECAKLDVVRAVKRIEQISVSGRAPKNDEAVFALAVIFSMTSKKFWKESTPDFAKQASQAVKASFLHVIRTGTHLMQFVDIVNAYRGWGSSLKKLVSQFYNQDAKNVAYQIAKYGSRENWTTLDVLRKAHVVPATDEHAAIFQYVAFAETGKKTGSKTQVRKELTLDSVPRILRDKTELTKPEATVERALQLMSENRAISHEMLAGHLKNDAKVWEKMIMAGMPLTALIRNLGKISSLGLTKDLSDVTRKICADILDVEKLEKARIHPLNVLVAKTVYESGHGVKGGNTWHPSGQIVSALEQAFYLSFKAIEKTNKRFLLGIDVSGSMGSRISDTVPISNAVAAAVMAMATMRVEDNSIIRGFSDRFIDLGIGKEDSLAVASAKVQKSNFGATDASLAIEWARTNKVPVDCFCIYTDNDVNHGRHVFQTLQNYRKEMNIDARLVVSAFQAVPYTIADPNDAGMLDLSGFDSAMPSIISQFAAGMF